MDAGVLYGDTQSPSSLLRVTRSEMENTFPHPRRPNTGMGFSDVVCLVPRSSL